MSAHRYGNTEFLIGDRPVGPGHPCYVIAEAGSNHNRDLDTAFRLIDVAAEAGADAVKFQTYTAEGLYSRRTPDMSYLKDQGLVGERESVWDLIKRVEIPWEWHADLAEHASRAGIAFFSTPFQEEAIDLLEGVGVPAYKIASYEVNHLPLIERAARTGKPLLISTGMASLGDIERALDTATAAGARDLLVMHCAVNYPPRFEDLNLRAIPTLQAAFQIPDRLVRSHAGAHGGCRRRNARRVRGGEALHLEQGSGRAGSPLRAGARRARGDGHRDSRG